MKKLLLMLFVSMCMIAYSQKITLVSGDFSVLKDQTEVNVELVFDNVLFQAENLSETKYLENRKNEILANPKNSKDDWVKWNDEWTAFKETKYIEKFLKGINHKSKKIVFKNNIQSKYTLVVKTRWIYAGWSGGFVMQPAKLTSEIKLVETDNHSKILFNVDSPMIEGVGIRENPNKEYIMEYGRISVAYEKTGRLLWKDIAKQNK
ncbi:hypothetical protein K0U91_07825 [Chryseobacterium chendengshani]|uniref:hypothetical protein n=1 Tax=Chryseobacterium sp. LJ668 TaxID=2864040 RepID=UPI001C688822|nr:hypothetical protein [Chryseobacterium sp. LJ668]MBW8522379.1 hypothetical protein [Chryseobacterium sp. LJ668]QYK18018.1 hypothetical protein K0U91_07825 [Chryseobacterium sp. LJ668]